MTDTVLRLVLFLAFVLVTCDILLSEASPADRFQSPPLNEVDSPDSDSWSLDDANTYSTVSKRRDKLMLLKRVVANLLPDEDDEEQEDSEVEKRYTRTRKTYRFTVKEYNDILRFFNSFKRRPSKLILTRPRFHIG